MRRYFPYLSVVLFGATLAMTVSAFLTYRLSRMKTVSGEPASAATAFSLPSRSSSSGENLFGAMMENSDGEAPVEAAPAPTIGPRRKLMLIGVMSGGASASAMIREVPTDSTRLFEVGDWVYGPEEYLVRVEAGSVLLGGASGYRRIVLGVVPTDEPAPAPTVAAGPVDPNAVALSRAEINASVSSPDEIIGSLQMVPEIRGGKMAGIKVTGKEVSAIQRRTGILPGDVILSINGQKLDSMERSVKLWESLKKAKLSSYFLVLEREGGVKTMSFAMKP